MLSNSDERPNVGTADSNGIDRVEIFVAEVWILAICSAHPNHDGQQDVGNADKRDHVRIDRNRDCGEEEDPPAAQDARPGGVPDRVLGPGLANDVGAVVNLVHERADDKLESVRHPNARYDRAQVEQVVKQVKHLPQKSRHPPKNGERDDENTKRLV